MEQFQTYFQREKGVVAEGKLQDKKYFIADRILAKHDENYMPPELKEIMKKMLSNLGNSLLFLNVLLSIIIIFYSLKSVKSSSNVIPSKIFKISLIQTTFVMSCFLL